jgi:tetratricopeptide (TPR) repeat protein
MRGAAGQAIADYSSAISLDPTSLIAYLDRGGTLYDIGEYDKAIADFTRAILINPMHPVAYVARGTAYKKTGEARRAEADLETAKKLGYTGPMP